MLAGKGIFQAARSLLNRFNQFDRDEPADDQFASVVSADGGRFDKFDTQRPSVMRDLYIPWR